MEITQEIPTTETGLADELDLWTGDDLLDDLAIDVEIAEIEEEDELVMELVMEMEAD